MKKLENVPDDGSGKQVVSAVTIVWCFSQLGLSFNPKVDEFVVPLMTMLQLKPSNKVCPGYDLLCSVLPKEDR